LPDEKKAVEQSIKTLYTVDMSTGEVKPAQLHTAERDEVLKLASQGVKDLGMQKLDGKDVRVLQSDDAKEPVKKIFVDPKTNAPVRIELNWPSRKGASFTYSSIRIDEPVDEKLFDLSAPAGYAVVESDRGEGEKLRKPIAEHAGKMLAKVVYTIRACHEYSFKHDYEFPEKLDDLKGTVNEKALRTLLAAPDKPDGPPVIVYRKPRAGKDSGTEIVAYETPESRQAGHVVVGMWDGHAEVVTQERFDELMKD
jgi:hypothetical protein